MLTKKEPYLKFSEAFAHIRREHPEAGKESLLAAIRRKEIPHRRSCLRPCARIQIQVSALRTYLKKLENN